MRMKWLCLSLTLGLIGCGLDDGGVVDVTPGIDVDSSAPDVIVVSEGGKQLDNFVPTDAPVQPEAGPDTSWPCGVDPTSCANTSVIPNGWTAVAVASTNLACGAGFGGEAHEKTKPVALSGACECQAQNTSPPDCQSGALQTAYGPLCAVQGATTPVANGACTAVNWQLSFSYSSKPIAPTGGSCTGAKGLDATKVSGSDLTTCAATTCLEKVCAGVVPQGFAACIESAGDVACPNGSPFNMKQTVGDAVSLTDCSACTCTPSATCGQPMVDFFSDNKCMNGLVSLTSDNACQATNNNAASVKGVMYTATVVPTYTVSGPKTPNVSLTNTKTICCR